MRKQSNKFSTLRDNLFDRLFGTYFDNKRDELTARNYSANTPVDLSQPTELDHTLLRQMYRNRNNKYAFSAHLIKPIIDVNCSFIGVPILRSANKAVLKELDVIKGILPFHNVHRIAEREGTVYVWPQIDAKGKMKFVILRPETVENICIDPVTKEIIAYIIIDEFEYKGVDGNDYNMKSTLTVTADTLTILNACSESKYSGVKVIPNVLGFIPIVAFCNDKEPWELRGHSEIENIEPHLKLYNDMTVEASRAQKRDGHPKMQVRTNDPASWVDRNFGSGTFDAMLAGTAYISIEDRDFFIGETGKGDGDEGDTISYVESNRTSGDYEVLSERSFTNIIEGAQNPEILFGANMGTSFASVKEQRPAFIKKIARKQMEYEVSWRQVINYALQIQNFVKFSRYKDDDYSVVWPAPDFSSEQEKAATLNTLSTSIIKFKEAHIVGDKEVFETLKGLDILKINQDEKEHIADIEETAKLMLERTEDATAKQNNTMNQRVGNGKYENTAVTDDNADKADKKVTDKDKKNAKK